MSENPEKKIIVDEDWKTQVEREREAALKGAGAEPTQTAGATPEIALPPANLTYLASSLSIQASIYLGLMPDPVSGKLEKDLRVAKHSIDMLEVLQQKTEGNRTPEETEDIEAMLHQLRMAYVQVVG
ncbi:MAG: DUF1844 domain-containing protein [Thermoguttaceae bacterium]